MTIVLRHVTTVALIQGDRLVNYLVRDYFDLPRRAASLAHSLVDRGLGQADLVLCLLHLRDSLPRSASDRRRLLAHYVHRLVGRPILVGESCLLKYRVNGRPQALRSRTPSDRKITWVLEHNPRQPQSDAAARWREFKVGRTVEQLRARGVTRRDLRRAERRGWIRLEEVSCG